MLITLLVYIVVLGLLAYCVQLLPIAEPFKRIALVILIIFAILVLLNAFGVDFNLPLRR